METNSGFRERILSVDVIKKETRLKQKQGGLWQGTEGIHI